MTTNTSVAEMPPTTRIPDTRLPDTNLVDVEITDDPASNSEETNSGKTPRRSLAEKIQEDPSQLDKAIFGLFNRTGLQPAAFLEYTKNLISRIQNGEYPTRRKKNEDILGKLVAEVRALYEGDEEQINDFLIYFLNSTTPEQRTDVLANKISIQDIMPEGKNQLQEQLPE